MPEARYKIKANDNFINIPGYENLYQINDFGIVRKLYKNGEARNLNPIIEYNKKRYNTKRVRYFLRKDNVVKRYSIIQLYTLVYGDKIPKDYVIFNKTGTLDLSLSNFGVSSKQYFYKHCNSHGKVVLLISKKTDKIIRTYKNAKEASNKLGMCYSTVCRQCRGVYKTLQKSNNENKLVYAEDFYKERDINVT